MGKYIANTATSYRFIACLGIFGLIAALGIGQTPHQTLRGTNIFVVQNQIGTTTVNGVTTPVFGANTFFSSGLPMMPAQPVITGFLNPFTGVSQPAVLFQTSSTANGSSTGGSTTGGTGGGTGVSGGAGGGGGSGVSGGGGGGGGFTVLPSISALPGGGNSLSGGANSGGVVGGAGGGGVTGSSGSSGVSGNTGVSGATGASGAGGAVGGGAVGGAGGGAGSKGSFCGGYGI
jgi:hypothetical protein